MTHGSCQESRHCWRATPRQVHYCSPEHSLCWCLVISMPIRICNKYLKGIGFLKLFTIDENCIQIFAGYSAGRHSLNIQRFLPSALAW